MPKNELSDLPDLPDLALDPAPRLTGGGIAAFVSTLITLPLGFVALVWVMFSPMACDSCGGAEADRFDAAFTIAFPVFMVGLLVSLGLLVAAWIPPRRAGFAVAAPLSVVVVLLVFFGILGTG